MDYSDIIIFVMEIVGTIAFAVSGAMTGIQKCMDIFGVNVLGVTTAMGGGLIRDLILGINPPAMFCNSTYALTAVGTSTITFLFVYIKEKSLLENRLHWETVSRNLKERYRTHELYEGLLLLGDTIGLGIFTVVGCYAAVKAGYTSNRFLLVFVGVMTGVGGGMLRDVLAGNMPYILIKHVYAVASLAGALVYALMLPHVGRLECMVAGAATVMLVRFLAAKFRWNLPRIR